MRKSGDLEVVSVKGFRFGGRGYSSHGNLFEKAVYVILIYPWRTNITINVLQMRKQGVAKKKEK